MENSAANASGLGGYAACGRPAPSAPWDMKKSSRILVGLLLLAGVLAGARFFPLADWVLGFISWARSAGSAGLLAYFLFYMVGVVLFLPGSLLTMGSGFIYGPIRGILLVSPASVIGATIAFLVARFFAREWVARRIATHPKFAAIDEAVGTRGFYIVFLLRLSPVVPFNMLNYALGLTRVKLRDYVVASFLGMLPGTFLVVYLGSLIINAAQLLSGQRPEAGPWGQIFFLAGLVATAIVTALITRISRRALNRALQDTRRMERSESGALPS